MEFPRVLSVTLHVNQAIGEFKRKRVIYCFAWWFWVWQLVHRKNRGRRAEITKLVCVLDFSASSTRA